jgi:hypothetical protein
MSKQLSNQKCFWFFHYWSRWSEPHERTYQSYSAPPALVPHTELRTFRSEIQDRTCERCGKYEWRKV